jgi:hypothetical protein
VFLKKKKSTEKLINQKLPEEEDRSENKILQKNIAQNGPEVPTQSSRPMSPKPCRPSLATGISFTFLENENRKTEISFASAVRVFRTELAPPPRTQQGRRK